MSPNTWQTSLQQLLKPQATKHHIAIVGIGNIFRSDDVAGVLVARKLLESRSISDLNTILVVDAGHAPENRTADLRRFAPEIVLFIDAAEMDEVPGAIRWIEMDDIEGMSASTHTLPLSMLAKYLTLELKCKIALLGIQPKSNEVGETVTQEVTEAIDIVVKSLTKILADSHQDNS